MKESKNGDVHAAFCDSFFELPWVEAVHGIAASDICVPDGVSTHDGRRSGGSLYNAKCAVECANMTQHMHL